MYKQYYRTNDSWLHILSDHDDVIKWKHFPRNWPFVREIHRSPVNFPHKGQWRGALMFSLIYVWMNDWVNNREAGDLRRQHGHYDVIVMWSPHPVFSPRDNKQGAGIIAPTSYIRLLPPTTCPIIMHEVRTLFVFCNWLKTEMIQILQDSFTGIGKISIPVPVM